MSRNLLFKKHYRIFWLLIIIFIGGILLPAFSYADAEKIFKENNPAVAVVVTHDAKGKIVRQGSGFVIRQDGVIVTNYHVISNGENISVKVNDNMLKVEGLLDIDKTNDIVILKAEGKNLQTVKLGDIDTVHIGEKVYVISSPLGFEHTISDGILSGIKNITTQRKIFQISAPISEGSSGGPVFNKDGEVIGIATFIVKGAQNLNFAMPIHLIKDKILSEKIIPIKDADIDDCQNIVEHCFIRGYYYKEAGLYEQAIESFQKGIKIKPEFIESYYALGDVYEKIGRYQEALEVYQQAITRKPDFAEAYYSIGNIHRTAGMHKEAIDAYKQALRINPEHAETYNNIGVSYGKLGMQSERINAYKEALKIKPDFAEAYSNLGNAYIESGKYMEAIQAYKEALRIKPDFIDSYSNLGHAYGKIKKYSEAVDILKQAIRIKPDDARAHFELGLNYFHSGNKVAALEEYKILKGLTIELADKLFNVIYK